MRALDIPHQGPAAARNAGAREAHGTHLAFTDDDCRPFPDWLGRFAEAFAEGSWDALAGRSLNPWPRRVPARSHEYLIDFLQNYSRFPNGDVYLACSNNAAYKREVFESLGGYDRSFRWPGAEDRELGHRLLARGFRQGYQPEARVWHDHALTAWQYVRLQFRYGRGDDGFRRALLRNRLPRWIGQRRRPQFHLALARQLQEDRAPLAMWALLALSQGAHFIGSRYERMRGGA
jgi:GT2 family glycosyltransferase